MKLFIIIPAYNEEKNIARVLANLQNELPEARIVVVDDFSQDETIQEASKFQNITLLKHILNRGQGAALQTGTQYAVEQGAEVIVHFDSDGQHQAKDIYELIKPIQKKKADVAMGSRFLGNSKNFAPFTKKYFILKPAKFVNYFFTGLKLTDAHNGFRALNENAAKKIIINQDRMAHSTEILTEIKKNKLKYEEVPVEIIYNEYGQNFFDGLKILKDLVKRKIL